MYPGLHIFFLLIQVNEKDAGTIELCLRATSTCLKAAVGDAVFGAPSEWTMTSQHSKRKDPTVTTSTSKDSGRFGRDLTMTFEKATTDDRTSVGRCEIRPLSRPDGFGTFSNEIRFAPRGDACEGGEKVEGLGNLRFETGIANNWELAAKIVGSKNTWDYGSSHWTSSTLFDNGDELKTWAWNVNSNKIKLVFNGNGCNGRTFEYTHNHNVPLHNLFGNQRGTGIGKGTWSSMGCGSWPMQNHCNNQGFNVHTASHRVRFGMSMNQEGNCGSPDSAWGIGIEPGSVAAGAYGGCCCNGGNCHNYYANVEVYVHVPSCERYGGQLTGPTAGWFGKPSMYECEIQWCRGAGKYTIAGENKCLDGSGIDSGAKATFMMQRKQCEDIGGSCRVNGGSIATHVSTNLVSHVNVTIQFRKKISLKQDGM